MTPEGKTSLETARTHPETYPGPIVQASREFHDTQWLLFTMGLIPNLDTLRDRDED